MLKFVQIRPGRLTSAPEFRIWVPGTPKNCPILEKLLKSADGLKMLRLFDEIVMNGLPMHNPNKCLHLRGKIFELKRGAKVGPKLRLFGFRDESRIILTEMNTSKRDDNPDSHIEKCEKFQQLYIKAKSAKAIDVHLLKDQGK